MKIKVLDREEHVKYLGSYICCERRQEVELKHRIQAAWAKFASHKQELTNKHYALCQRLRLFDATVTPTALYGSTGWTLTKDMENDLCRTQRRMLRLILGSSRQVKIAEQGAAEKARRDNESGTGSVESDEDSNGPLDVKSVAKKAEAEMPKHETLELWSEWIQRTTHQIERTLAKMKFDSWVTQSRTLKWRFAHRIATHNDARWTKRAAAWDPKLLFDGRCRASRAQARPKKRWEDDIKKFLQAKETSGSSWREAAKDGKWWKMHEEDLAGGEKD